MLSVLVTGRTSASKKGPVILRGRVINALGRHVQYSVTCSVTGVQLSPGAPAYQRIISNNSYAHDEQGDNPGQE